MAFSLDGLDDTCGKENSPAKMLGGAPWKVHL